MTITVYVVHVYERGRYVRSMEEPMTRRTAYILSKTFNANEGDKCLSPDPRSLPEWPQRAVVEAVPLKISPPDRMPETEPFGPGIKPTRRTPAVV